MTIIPSTSNSVGTNVEDIILGGAVGASLQATAMGRKKEGGPLAGVPVDDPMYVPVTIGNFTILHYLWPFMWIPFCVLMFIGLVPFWALAIWIHNASSQAGNLSLIILVPLYLYLVVWKIGIRKYWAGICRKLF